MKRTHILVYLTFSLIQLCKTRGTNDAIRHVEEKTADTDKRLLVEKLEASFGKKKIIWDFVESLSNDKEREFLFQNLANGIRNNDQGKLKILKNAFIQYNKQQLLIHLNRNFTKTPDLNEKFVEYVDLHGKDFSKFNVNPERFYNMTSDPISKAFIEENVQNEVIKSIQLLVTQNESIQKAYSSLEQNGNLSNINLEMMFNPNIMDEYIHKQVMLQSLKEDLLGQFRDNSALIDKFGEFLFIKAKRADDVRRFYENSKNLTVLKNDPLMKKFIDMNKRYQIMNVIKSINNTRISMQQIDICVNINEPVMLFNKAQIRRVIVRCSLEDNLNRQFSDALDVVGWFLKYLNNKKAKNLMLYNVEPANFYSLDKDQLMIDFLEKYKSERIKNVLSVLSLTKEEKQSLSNENISIKLMFNSEEVLRKHLIQKLDFLKLENCMKKHFPNLPNLNKKFVNFIKNSTENPRKYILRAEDLFELKNDLALTKFVDDNKNDYVMGMLETLNPQSAASDFDIMIELGVLDSIDVEKLFKPDLMKTYLQNVYISHCKTEFEKQLIRKPVVWGRTPDKCIIDPICNSTSTLKFRSSNEIEAELDKYPTMIERTFDEVDEMIFDMTRDDADNRRLNYDGDIDCLVAFMKRKNVGDDKWYDIELLTNDGKRKKKLDDLITEFENNRT